MHDEYAAIERAELFRGLDQAALRDIAHRSSARSVAKGRVLFNQGDRSDHLFLVSQGKFKLSSVAEDGSQRMLRFMGPADIIGCAAVFNRVPYPATATATVESAVVSWTAFQLNDFVQKYPQLATNALSIMGSRTSEILQRLHETGGNTVEQRIARAIIRLIKNKSTSDPDLPLQLRLSRQDLAELSDASLFTVSRTIAKWARARIITCGRQRITVCDLARLQQMAGA